MRPPYWAEFASSLETNAALPDGIASELRGFSTRVDLARGGQVRPVETETLRSHRTQPWATCGRDSSGTNSRTWRPWIDDGGSSLPRCHMASSDEQLPAWFGDQQNPVTGWPQLSGCGLQVMRDGLEFTE
ncbi:MAG: hypothetical protein RL385_2288 [Pseudomonadota bacterium]